MSVDQVVSLLRRLPGVSHIDASPDLKNAITNVVVRCVYDGR